MTPGAGGLAPAELDDLLRRPILARLATNGPDGWPSIVPVWFEWDGEAVLLLARARARFVEDLLRDPRACLSVVADDDPDRRAQLYGRATFTSPAGPLDGPLLEVARRMAVRYEGTGGLDYMERTRDLDRVAIRIVPERVVSWGSPDWHPRYRGSPDGGSPAVPDRRHP